jgi:alkylation response protein AidB-like acyl-CoA dehydrogenase
MYLGEIPEGDRIMDFGLSEEQRMLKNTARRFFEKECPKAMVREMAKDERGYSPQLWQKMAELGWLGLIFPTKYGGADRSFLDLVILLEEMGRALPPSPFFATVVSGGLSILEAGNEQQKERFLPKVTNGEILLTLAITEPNARYEADSIAAEAELHDSDFIINGVKVLVPYGRVADYIVCIARTRKEGKLSEGASAFIVNAKSPGMTITSVNTIGQDKQCEILFENVPVSRQNILGELNSGWAHAGNVLQKAAVGLCAHMNGGTEKVIDMAREHAMNRVQFGQSISSFQAIQHRLADMLIRLEASKVLTYDAAWKISEGLSYVTEAAIAKAWASESYRQATWLAMEIQGGVAFIEDHDMPLYYRWAKAAETTFGDADFHREIIARILCE